MITLAVVSDLGGSHLRFTSAVADRANRCRVTPVYRNGSRWSLQQANAAYAVALTRVESAPHPAPVCHHCGQPDCKRMKE